MDQHAISILLNDVRFTRIPAIAGLESNATDDPFARRFARGSLRKRAITWFYNYICCVVCLTVAFWICPTWMQGVFYVAIFLSGFVPPLAIGLFVLAIATLVLGPGVAVFGCIIWTNHQTRKSIEREYKAHLTEIRNGACLSKVRRSFAVDLFRYHTAGVWIILSTVGLILYSCLIPYLCVVVHFPTPRVTSGCCIGY